MTVTPKPPELRAVTVSEPRTEIDEAELWRHFAAASTLREVVTHWLMLLRLRLSGMRAASVFRVDAASGAIETYATWPRSDDDLDRLASAAHALAQRVPLILSAAHGFHLAYAFDAEEPWIVVIETPTQSANELQSNLDALRWGAGWLLARSAHMVVDTMRAHTEDLQLAARLSENVARETDASKAAGALASGLAAIFETRCVTVGLLRRRQLTISALQRDDGTRRIDEVSAVEVIEVMNAALSSARTLIIAPHDAAVPMAQDNAFDVLAASGAACVIPLTVMEKKVGVVLLERAARQPFTPKEVETLEAIALQVAPLIDAKPLMVRSSVTKERRWLVSIFGPVRLKLKLALIALLVLCIVMLGATGAYEVRANAVVEGGDAQVALMPASGTITSVLVKRGDTVRKGQVLAKLEDQQARGERERLIGVRNQVEQVLREARDIRDSAASETLEAKLAEANSAIARLDTQLARTNVLSPVDGTLSAGRALNAPNVYLKEGESAFAIVPSEGYRLVLWVEQSELSVLKEGQEGRAYFAEIPSEVLFTVRQISDVAKAQDGKHRVRVEAQLQTYNDRTRPGLSGNANIDAGKKKLVWIWWHKLRANS